MKTFFVKSLCKATVLLIGIISFGFMMQSCSIDSDINKEMSDFTTYLSMDKSDFDFGRDDWESLSESDKTTFNMAHKRMDFTFDKDGICTTKWTSSNQVNMSDELFNYFIDVIAFTNEMTKKLSEGQKFTPPRLKTGGNECNPADYYNRINCCLVRAIYSLYSGPPYTTIDSWLCDKGYYQYAPTGNYWGVKPQYTSTVLYHFLAGSALLSPWNNNLTNKCILILKGTPRHAVVFSSYGPGSTVNFTDPSGTSSNHTCSMSDIEYVFKATGIK
jgi:hypothetical protein